ncbi:hypothetical protein AWR27_14795 [Spirosoma montaniterrae]|uniref:N-acetyltransferase domain-containing protein n=2 Tax=Spirosoma montaniterrae TaxID=1178516 RepID=A0A1P9WYT1_9BACT|nr:hypothetical protein AWR27_14795 [Spirosoma montaniterrae]
MLAELHDLFTNPSVRRYLLDDQCVAPEWTADVIATSQQQFVESNYGLWAVQQAGYRPIIGVCGYFTFDQLQLLYALLPNYWGQGFATEAARAVIDYGFHRTNLTEIVAAADLLNTASFGVMERLGMTYQQAKGGVIYYQLPKSQPHSLWNELTV